MNIKQAAQAIRDTVDMESVLSLYGYKPKRGVMPCPFHGERNPSLKIYAGTGGWHCFGCGRGGSVIDFVMEHEGCTFGEAVRAIDKALHLGLMDPKEDPFKAADQRRIQEALDRFVTVVYELCDARIRSLELTQKMNLSMAKAIEEKPTPEITAEEWDVIHQWADDDQYMEYKKELIESFKEEVAAWRRKARRAT